MAVTELTINDSSHIKSATYNDETLELVVSFPNGTYSYAGVPANVASEFAAAPRAGVFLHARIKNQYAARKL